MQDGVNSILHCWNTAKKKAGITRELTPYSLRHKFATDLLAAGTDPGTVAKLMGHSSTDMIFAHYQHVMTQQKVQAIENLPKISDKAVCARHEHNPCALEKTGSQRPG